MCSPSSTCAVPDCGAVTNLAVLRAPADGDFSAIEDALDSAFDNSFTLVDVVDRKLCTEHMAIVTPAQRKSKTRDELQIMVDEMKAFRGEHVSAFVTEALRAFQILPAADPPLPASYLASRPFPTPVHGLIYFKDLQDHFETTMLDKKSDSRVLERRTLLRILTTALAPFGVHTDKDPRSGFIYFFRRALVVAEVRQFDCNFTCQDTDGAFGSGSFVPPLRSEDERAELQRLSEIFKSLRPTILEGGLSIRDLVTCVSSWYWVYQTWTLASRRQREAWIRTTNAKKLRDPSFTWPCGNRKENLPSGDVLHTLLPSSVNLVRRVLTDIERRVTILTGAAGPIGLSVGAVVHMKGTKSLQIALSRLGLCCSYDESLKVRAFYANQRQAHHSKAFGGVPPNYLVCMSLDNADFSLPNSINIAGKSTNGEHFTFASVHAMELTDSSPRHIGNDAPNFSFKNPLLEFPTRKDLVSNFTTKENDPDLTAYSTVLLGRVWQLRSRLQSTDPKAQISLRHLLFSSMDVFPAQNSVVIFARLEDFKASDANELLGVIEEAVLEMLPGQPGRYELLGVSGDFPVIWIVWQEWVKRLVLARKEGKELKWFPFPSGAAFHDLKVGALPTLKKLMEGALVEDLIKNGRAGLSKWYAENWLIVGNLRKNRRVNDSVIVAAILSAIPTLRSEDPVLDSALDAEIEDERGYVQNEIAKTGSKLKVATVVSRKAYEDGKAIRASMLKFSSTHRNADFYLRLILLDLLIPTTALQILSRCGQTSIYQKFYFNISPFIMQTTKLSYQKHSVMTMHILAVLPATVIADIFGGNPGALVVNAGTNPFANMPQDETLELNIGTIKALPIRKKEPLLNSVTWCGELSRMACALLKALDLEFKPGTSFKSKQDLKWDDDGVLLIYDKEHGGATNVSEFLKLTLEKGQFSEDNLKKQYLCNVLGESLVEVRDEKMIEDLLSMRSSGQKKMEVLVSRIVPGYIEMTWRPSDLEIMGIKKQPKKIGAWTKSGAVRTVADASKAANAASQIKSVKSPAELDGDKTWSSFAKKWNSRVALLLPVISNEDDKFSAAMTASAQKLLSHLHLIAHMSSPLALCYRSADLSLKPGFGFECRQRPAVKSSFFRTLHSEASSGPNSSRQDLNFLIENGAHPKLYDVVQVDVENVGHHALQKTARSGTIGEVMEEQMMSQMRPLMTGHRSSRLKHVHFHCDNRGETVEQKGGTQALRHERNGEGRTTPECRDFCEDVITATIARSEKEGFTSGYLFYGALSALKLDADFEESEQRGSCWRRINVYLHGGSFGIFNDAMGVALDHLDIMKCPDTSGARVLVFRKAGGRPKIVAGVFPPGVTVFPRSTCFCVSQELGISTCAYGASSHGEAETRFIFAYKAISKPILERARDSQCLIVSNDSDCPAISVACADVTAGANFVHKVSSQFIYIDSLLSFLKTIGLSPDAIVGSFALGGCDFCPGTAGVSQILHLRALLLNARLCRGWRNLAKKPELDDGRVLCDFEAVLLLTGLAFALKYETIIAESDRAPSFLGMISDQDPDQMWGVIESWLVRVRKAIVRKTSVLSSALCLPETNDIILQGRRASFVFQYWKGSHQSKWDRDAIGGVEDGWGYCRDATGGCWTLFELECDVEDRKTKVAYPFTKCGCSECKRMTCSCRKADLVCITGLCGKCEGACVNDGVAEIAPATLSTDPNEVEFFAETGDVIFMEGSEDDEEAMMNQASSFEELFESDSESDSGYGTT